MPKLRLKLLLAVALASATLVLLPSSAASAAAPAGFVGLQGWETPAVNDWSRLDRARVRLWRMFVYWSAVERVQGGPYDWTAYDQAFEQAAAAGVRILPVVIGGSPSWSGANRHHWQPRTRAGRRAFYAFAGAAAARYGPGGQFWQERPTLRRLPANRLQVWNEPNHPYYWESPNPREYAGFLISSARAIRAANPYVKIVIGGILNNNRERYLDAFYRVRGARRAFDVMAIHSFTRYASRVLGAVDRTRRVMRRHGDRRKALMITEVGIATNSPGGKLSTTERGQAYFVRALYGTLLRNRRSRRLLGAVWFTYRDRERRAGEQDWWAIRTGLFRVDDRPKPSWWALLRVTGGSR